MNVNMHISDGHDSACDRGKRMNDHEIAERYMARAEYLRFFAETVEQERVREGLLTAANSYEQLATSIMVLAKLRRQPVSQDFG